MFQYVKHLTILSLKSYGAPYNSLVTRHTVVLAGLFSDCKCMFHLLVNIPKYRLGKTKLTTGLTQHIFIALMLKYSYIFQTSGY